MSKTPSGANAPYQIQKRGEKWAVVNNIGETKATFDSHDKALAYQRALYASVPGAAKRAEKVKFTGKARQRVPKEKAAEPLKMANGSYPISDQHSANSAWKLRNHSKDYSEAQVVAHIRAAVKKLGLKMPSTDSERADLRARLTADYTPSQSNINGIGQHTYVPGSDDRCLQCGLPQVNPNHDGVEEMVAQEVEGAAYEGKGCMVALYPTGEMLKGLVPADDDAEDEDDMHITLAYMKETPEGQGLDHLKAVVNSVASKFGRLDGVWGGTGKFNPSEGSDGKPVSVALPDIPGLPTLREHLVRALDSHGFPVSKDHGYTPHMTLAYAELEKEPVAKGDISFGELVLTVGGQRYPYPLQATPDAEMSAEDAVSANAEREEALAGELAAARKHKKHRYVGASHLSPHVIASAGWHTGCYACGNPAGDPDHDGDVDQPGTPDVEAAATSPDQLAKQREDQHIKINSEKPESLVPHEFKPAAFPKSNGRARCINCGQEETVSGICNDPIFVTPKAELKVPGPGDTPLNQQASLDAITTGVILNGIYLGGASNAEIPLPVRQTWKVNEAEKADLVPLVEDAPISLPATRAFLTEAYGKTLLTAPASTFRPLWETAGTPNKHFLWMQGRFVGAEKANRNGAFWATKDLEMGEPTVKHGPLNWLHEANHVIGTIADAKLVAPTLETADAGADPAHIMAMGAIWQWLYPNEAFVVEQASDQGSLYYSMECISREVGCIGDNGCGNVYPYIDAVKGGSNVCQHIREKSSTRHFIDPTFLGGAVIVPPVRPGWGEANAQVMREASALAEKAFEDAGNPDMTTTQWESLMAAVLSYAGR